MKALFEIMALVSFGASVVLSIIGKPQEALFQLGIAFYMRQLGKDEA